jgi:hypothetical protein
VKTAPDATLLKTNAFVPRLFFLSSVHYTGNNKKMSEAEKCKYYRNHSLRILTQYSKYDIRNITVQSDIVAKLHKALVSQRAELMKQLSDFLFSKLSQMMQQGLLNHPQTNLPFANFQELRTYTRSSQASTAWIDHVRGALSDILDKHKDVRIPFTMKLMEQFGFELPHPRDASNRHPYGGGNSWHAQINDSFSSFKSSYFRAGNDGKKKIKSSFALSLETATEAIFSLRCICHCVAFVIALHLSLLSLHCLKKNAMRNAMQ